VDADHNSKHTKPAQKGELSMLVLNSASQDATMGFVSDTAERWHSRRWILASCLQIAYKC